MPQLFATIASDGASVLFQYGALGVIAAAFMLLVYYLMRQGFKDRERFIGFLIAKDSEQAKVLSALSENIAESTAAARQGYARLTRSFRETQQTLLAIQDTNTRIVAYLDRQNPAGTGIGSMAFPLARRHGELDAMEAVEALNEAEGVDDGS